MRKLKISVITALSFVVFTSQSFANNFSSIKVNNEEKQNLDIVTINNVNMINAGVFARELDLNVKWNNIDKLVTIVTDENEIVTSLLGDINIKKENKNSLMYEPAFIKDDRIYIPLRNTCEVLGYSVDYKESDKSINIYKNENMNSMSTDYLEYIMNDNEKYGITSIKGVYTPSVDEEYAVEAYYSRVYLKDFTENKYYDLGRCLGNNKATFVNNNQVLSFDSLQYIHDDGVNVNCYNKHTFNLFDLETKENVFTDKAKYLKLSEDKDIIYYVNDDGYMKLDVNLHEKTKITSNEYNNVENAIYLILE